MKIRYKYEKLGGKDTYIRVKRVTQRGCFPYYVAGGQMTDDEGILHINTPCGRGGCFSRERSSAIKETIRNLQSYTNDSPNVPKNFTFSKANAVFEEILQKIER